MRGYLSFLLVLAIMAALFAFLHGLPALYSGSDYRAIEAERTYSVSMNVKEAIALSTSYWLRASAYEFDSTPREETGTEDVERELAIRQGILEGWALLTGHEFSQDFEVELWCGQISETTREELSRQMMENKGVALCPGCTSLDSPLCMEYIQVIQGEPLAGNDSVRLAAPSLPGRFGVVGASIYSPKYGTANVVYIPVSEEIG
jgi:hypothetical protein